MMAKMAAGLSEKPKVEKPKEDRPKPKEEPLIDETLLGELLKSKRQEKPKDEKPQDQAEFAGIKPKITITAKGGIVVDYLDGVLWCAPEYTYSYCEGTSWGAVFSVRMVAAPFLTCGLPKRTASPRRSPVYSSTSNATRSLVPCGHRAS
jgi:hypothetical protein